MGGNLQLRMIILTQTTDKIRVFLTNNVASNQMQCYSCYRDSNSTTFTADRNVVLTNNATPVNLVDSPASGISRGIDFLSVFNADTTANTVTIVLDANGTQYELTTITLLPNEKLEYTDAAGFVIKTSTGRTKVDVTSSTNALTFSLNRTTLANDVINSTTSFADVTNLSFDVKAKTVYWFAFYFRYTSAAGTTGSAWSINGPAFNYLAYDSFYSLGAATLTTNASLIAYDSGTLATTTTNTLQGWAVLTGFTEPSADGTLIARFRSEVAASAITAKAGSFVRWRELYKYS